MAVDWSSDEYAEKSLVQQNAAGKLLGLFGLKGSESVLDVGCGPGHITALIAGITTGRVVGADASEAMIEEARERFRDIEFRVVRAEELDYESAFDAVFCSSALQWFSDAALSIRGMYRALKSPGRIALAGPGTSRFSPFFEKVIGGVALRPDIAPVFAHWRSPWFFLPGTDSYRDLFERAGFRTSHISIDLEANEYTVDEAYGVYSIGAAMGFANPAYYGCEVSADFIKEFNQAVREEMERLATGGRLLVEFNRLYYVGEKAR